MIVRFLEYLGNEKCFYAKVFCLVLILPLTFLQSEISEIFCIRK